MRYYFFILVVLLLLQANSQTVLLTPILPASAFQNEFYQVRFRVRNLVGARFQFKNVPQFFTVSSEGLISGVPTKKGLYPIEVTYFNDGYKDSKEVIIQVRRGTKLLNYNSESIQQQSTIVVSKDNKLKVKQQYQFTYNEGEQLSIQVRVMDGVGPYRFEVIYMPVQMMFDGMSGGISGAFNKYGQYVMGVRVRDSRDGDVQVLIKVVVNMRSISSGLSNGVSSNSNSNNNNNNVNNNTNKTNVKKVIFDQRSLIEVWLKGTNNKSTINNSSTSQNSTINNVGSTSSSSSTTTTSTTISNSNNAGSTPTKNSNTNVNANNSTVTTTNTPTGGSISIINNNDIQKVINNNNVDSTKPAIINTINTATNTTIPIINTPTQQTIPNTNNNTPTIIIDKPQSQPQTTPIIPQSIANQAQSDKKTTQIIPTENLLNKSISINNNDSTINLQKIQQQKQLLNTKLILSQTTLKSCYTNVQTSRQLLDTLLNTYNTQFNKVETLKNQLQQLKTKSNRASTDLTQKLDKLNILNIQKIQAQQQYNRSLASYQNVNFAHSGSMVNINKNQQDILNKQIEIDNNKNILDSLYKTLDQTLTLNNQLEQHKNQLNQQIKNGIGLTNQIDTTKVNFGGCQNYQFNQKSIGVGQVKKAIDKTYLLTNNQFITFGDCTNHAKAKPGDFIQWKGYLWKGSVSALVIKKLK